MHALKPCCAIGILIGCMMAYGCIIRQHASSSTALNVSQHLSKSLLLTLTVAFCHLRLLRIFTFCADFPSGATYSAFKGSAQDYLDLYAPAALRMRETAPDSLIGGPALAYNIMHDPLNPHSISGRDLVQAAAYDSLPLDFFSFHIISTCADTLNCDLTKVRAGMLLMR